MRQPGLHLPNGGGGEEHIQVEGVIGDAHHPCERRRQHCRGGPPIPIAAEAMLLDAVRSPNAQQAVELKAARSKHSLMSTTRSSDSCGLRETKWPTPQQASIIRDQMGKCFETHLYELSPHEDSP